MGRDQRQPQARVAGGGFDDGRAGADFALALGRFDHRAADAVFDRAARVLVFELEKQLAAAAYRAWSTANSGVLPIMSSRLFAAGGVMGRELPEVLDFSRSAGCNRPRLPLYQMDRELTAGTLQWRAAGFIPAV